jgi:hypothetical protein
VDPQPQLREGLKARTRYAPMTVKLAAYCINFKL